MKEGVAAGALGFSMSRTFAHKAIDGEYVPGTTAEVDEILGIGLTLGELGQGVVELAPAGVVGEDLNAPEREVAWMRELARRTGRPVTLRPRAAQRRPGGVADDAEAGHPGAARTAHRCTPRCTGARPCC